MNKKIRLLTGLLLVLAFMFSIVGCGGNTATAKKVLKVGTDAAYAPFESVNAKGEIEGFDIDLIKEIAKEMGYEVEISNIPFDGLIPALQNKNIDLIISAMTITDERKQNISFSAPYFTAVQAIAVPADSTVVGMADLKDLLVGVQNATTGQTVVEKSLGEKNPNIKRFDTTPDALNNLLTGNVKAVVADKPVVQNFLKNNSNAKIKLVDDSSFTKEEYGIGINKENADLLTKVNDALKKIQDSKKIEEISDKFLK